MLLDSRSWLALGISVWCLIVRFICDDDDDDDDRRTSGSAWDPPSVQTSSFTFECGIKAPDIFTPWRHVLVLSWVWLNAGRVWWESRWCLFSAEEPDKHRISHSLLEYYPEFKKLINYQINCNRRSKLYFLFCHKQTKCDRLVSIRNVYFYLVTWNYIYFWKLLSMTECRIISYCNIPLTLHP